MARDTQNLQNQENSQTELTFENDSENPFTEEDSDGSEGNEEVVEPEASVGEEEESKVTKEDIEILSRTNRGILQQNNALKLQLEELTNSLKPKPEPARKITQDDFNNDPADAMDRMLEEKLNKAIAPIREKFEAEKKHKDFTDKFESVISELNPAWPQYKDALMPEVVKFLGTSDPTPLNIKMATLMAVGNAFATGQFNGQAPSGKEEKEEPKKKTVPPSTKGTNRVLVSDGKKVVLSESMKRNMLRSGFEEGQEQDFIDSLGSEEVTFDALDFTNRKKGGKK